MNVRALSPFHLLPTLLALLASALLPARATAQIVVGRVTEEATAAPVEGAFVALLDDDGVRHGGALTRADGTFALRADGPGRYHLQVDRIGYATATSGAFALAVARTVRRDLQVATRAISLEGIDVEGERRCELGSDEGSRTLTLWEQARKALTVAAWTGETGYRFQASTFTRTLDRYGRVQEDSRQQKSLMGTEVFESLAADSLARYGYVRREGESWVYYGPDAEVLLSDSFLRTHCFRATQEDGRVGLAFEPAPGRDLPDVEGTLWFDPDQGILQELEFHYARLPAGRSYGVAGGEVRFEWIPDGAWIVRDWVLRMPLVGQEPGYAGRLEERMVGIRETGGEVTELEAIAPEGYRRERPPESVARERCGVVAGARAAALTGLTLRADDGEPLPGTVVEVRWTTGENAEARGLRVVSDSVGVFVACGLPAARALQVRAVTTTGEERSLDVHPLAEADVRRMDVVLGGGFTP